MVSKEIRQVIVNKMLERGWRNKLAKKGENEQSLLEHSLNVLDVVITLIDQKLVNFTEREQQILVLAATCHDIGKETDEWQDYIIKGGKWVSHTRPDLAETMIDEIAGELDWEISSEALAAVKLHMTNERTTGATVTELFTEHKNNQWKILCDLIDAIDNFVSIRELLNAKYYWENSVLRRCAQIDYHSARVRGISTTLLHKAAMEAYFHNGWFPVLFFPEGTLYITKLSNEKRVNKNDIESILKENFKELFKRKKENFPKLLVGGILQTFFPKPELFDLQDLRSCLWEATKRAKAKEKVDEKNVYKYYNMKRLLDETGDYKIAKLGDVKDLIKIKDKLPEEYKNLVRDKKEQFSQEEINFLSNRMGRAQPEIAVQKYFTKVIDPRNDLVKEHELKYFKQAYEEIFGENTFDMLMSTSTLMPANDVVLGIDHFWNQPGCKFGVEVSKIELLPAKKRQRILIDTLVEIAEQGFRQIEKKPSIDHFIEKISHNFMNDIYYPGSADADIKELTRQQINSYTHAKRNLCVEKKGDHICPVCNSRFKKGVSAIADILDKPGSFNNRAFAYDRIENIMICQNCYYERLLQQIVLGGRPKETICIFPQMNISFYGGQIIEEKVLGFQIKMKEIEGGAIESPNSVINLRWHDKIARNVVNNDLGMMSTDEFCELFKYQMPDETQKKCFKKMVTSLAEEFDGNIEEVNQLYGKQYASWDELAQEVQERPGNFDQIVHEICVQAYNSYPQLEVVFQTPNVIMIPTYNPVINDSGAIGEKDEADSKKVLKQILISLMFFKYLDMSVAILEDKENFGLIVNSVAGAVYIPPNAIVRTLFSNKVGISTGNKAASWISRTDVDKWLNGLIAANQLTYRLDYPQKNNLYTILTAEHVGKLLRRIKIKRKGITGYDIDNLEKLKEVLSECW